jgi:hypothetical protein
VPISSKCDGRLDRGGDALAEQDLRNGPGRWKTMRLYPHEFIRRFLLHVLPNVSSHPPEDEYFQFVMRR